jgi:hypothetical protein
LSDISGQHCRPSQWTDKDCSGGNVGFNSLKYSPCKYSSEIFDLQTNYLKVLGCCFVAGGLHGGQQRFNATAANTMSSLMAVAR